MKRKIVNTALAIACACTFGLSALACGPGEENAPPAKHTHSYTDGVCSCGKYEVPFLSSLPMAQELQADCDQKGTVQDFTYTSYAYAYAQPNDEQLIEVTKTAQVYLPYGYDASKKYNVLYLMHGGGETYLYWLTKMGATTTNVLDNMIKDKKCDPTIVVCPTVHTALPEGSEELQATSSDTAAFPTEFKNDLIPAVETHFSTYLGSDASEANIRATRDHRGFAGFSMGSVTSCEVLRQTADVVAYIGSFSAGMTAEEGKPASQIYKDVLTGSGKFASYPIKYWFNMNGTSDFALDGHQKLYESVMSDMSDTFVNGKNYAWILVKGGSHAYNCWIMGMYNCLLVFYK